MPYARGAFALCCQLDTYIRYYCLRYIMIVMLRATHYATCHVFIIYFIMLIRDMPPCLFLPAYALRFIFLRIVCRFAPHAATLDTPPDAIADADTLLLLPPSDCHLRLRCHIAAATLRYA